MKNIIILFLISFFSSTFGQLPFSAGNVGNCWTIGNLAKQGGIKTCYEAAIPWESGSGCLKRGEKWAIYCPNSEHKIEISEPIFDTVMPLNVFFCYKEKETHKCGLINDTFAILCPAKYDSIGLFARWIYSRIEPPMPREMQLSYMPYATVLNQQKYGLINTYGKEILPCEYDKVLAISSFSFYEAPQKSKPDSLISKEYDFYAIQKNKKYALFQVGNGKYSPFKYDKISPLEKSDYYFEVLKNGRYGLIDTTFKEILPCAYNRIWVWNDSLWRVKKGKVSGVLDNTGKIILPFVFEEIGIIKDYDYKGDFYFKTRKNGKIETWSNIGKPFDLQPIKREDEDFAITHNTMYHIS